MFLDTLTLSASDFVRTGPGFWVKAGSSSTNITTLSLKKRAEKNGQISIVVKYEQKVAATATTPSEYISFYSVFKATAAQANQAYYASAAPAVLAFYAQANVIDRITLGEN